MKQFGVRISYPGNEDRTYNATDKEYAERWAKLVTRDSTPARAVAVSREVGEWEEVCDD